MQKFHDTQTADEDRQKWRTPPEIVRGAEILIGQRLTTDAAASEHNAVAANYYTEQDNALIIDWSADCELNGIGKAVWLNPPYGSANGGIARWIDKAHTEAQKGCTVVMLVPAATDTAWFQRGLNTAHEIVLITGGRLSFVHASTGARKNGNKMGSCLMIFRPGLHFTAQITTFDRDALATLAEVSQ